VCGIAGAMGGSALPGGAIDRAVRRMTARMAPRGPDAEGIWHGEEIVLGHRRLAILDLDVRSNQPMASADRRYHVVFNGEIYNFRELRRELAGKGERFCTSSDTEVLLALYAREREAMLPRLRGMFAFAIWDSVARELFLARDPYGIKPLYYTSTAHGFAFASQVKALQASELLGREVEPAAVAGFYLWGSVPEPWTLARHVLALPAGHWLRVRGGDRPSPVCWAPLADLWCEPESSSIDLRAHVRDAVAASIRSHMVSDVPVCVFLSSGIDSTVVAALAAEHARPIAAVTVGFDEFAGRPEDEVPAAAAIADHYGLEHSVRRVSMAEFAADLPNVLDAMDQPSIDGVNTWFASKAAAERGFKVALSGVGGDELLCGYSSFQRLPRAARAVRAMSRIPGGRSLVDAGCRYLSRNPRRAKLAALPEVFDSFEGMYFLSRAVFVPGELPALMGRDAAADALERLGTPGRADARMKTDATAEVARLESTHYLRNQLLRDADWSSMAHSLEVRTPLVDAWLLRSLAPWTQQFARGRGKQMLARVPTKAIPEAIANRPKTGFSLPMSQWLERALPTHTGAAAATARNARQIPWARRWAATVLDAAVGCG